MNLKLFCVHSRSVMSDFLPPHGLQPTRLLCPWGFSRQEYWSGLPCPPPGIFPTQGLNPGLPHCRQMLYRLSHQGSIYNERWSHITNNLGFLGGLDGKESTCNSGDLGSSPGLGRSLEKGMATHSSILAWIIPWTV